MLELFHKIFQRIDHSIDVYAINCKNYTHFSQSRRISLGTLYPTLYLFIYKQNGNGKKKVSNHRKKRREMA